MNKYDILDAYNICKHTYVDCVSIFKTILLSNILLEFTVTVEGNSHPTTLDVASSQPVNSVESYSVRLTHTGNWTKFYFLK